MNGDHAQMEEAVRAAEARRGELLVAKDYAGLERLFSPDLIHIHSTGVRHTRAELIDLAPPRRSHRVRLTLEFKERHKSSQGQGISVQA